ncbi:MAG: helix-turn-helix domain-containing protein [Terracidiphilus sp.]|nr:helix-turn-helix domain-containing protein [Terracidiphilus sp.]
MLESVSKSIPSAIPPISGRRDGLCEPQQSNPETGDPNPGESLAQVDRIVKSNLLYSSETLCKLLEYLAQHTLNTPDDHLKEYRIATEILGRCPDFDPRYDASVRVQIGRLRTKLAEYYGSTGAGDPILVDIPKGRYTLSFERRSVDQKPEAQQTEFFPAPESPVETGMPAAPTTRLVKPHGRRSWRLVMLVLVACALLLGSRLLVRFFVHKWTVRAPATQSAADIPAAFSVFWGPFLSSPEEPFVIFSNAAFVGDAESGLRYFDPARDSHDRVTYHYTGVGEVMDVVELDRLFHSFGRQFRIKPGGLFTLDDARNNNLIFVGSPTENTTLREIPNSHEFVFRHVPDGHGLWNQEIVDLHPQPGEASTYVPTPRSRPLDVDYAIISFSQGLDRTRWTLILAGTSTIGTQAAVDYVCNRNSLEQLLRSLNVKSESDLQPFEALLRVKVADDVPIESQLILLRRTGN